MSIDFHECNGTIHKVQDGGGRGVYQVRPGLPSGTGVTVINQIDVGMQEIVQPVTTLDGKKMLYVYGSAWSDGQLSATQYLGNNYESVSNAGLIVRWYMENRVSVLNGPIDISIGVDGVEAYVVGIRMGQIDPGFNKQEFTILFNINEE